MPTAPRRQPLDDGRTARADASGRGTGAAAMRAAARGAWPELALWLAIGLAVWLKLGAFSLPIEHRIVQDWGGWTLRDALIAQASSVAPLLLLAAPVALLAPVRRVATLLALDVVLTLVLLADLVHFRFFTDVVSVSQLGDGPQLRLLLPNIVALLRTTDVLLFADVALLLAAWPRIRRRLAAAPRRAPWPWWPRWAPAALLLAAGLVASALPVAVVVRRWNTVFAYDFFRFIGVRQIGLLNYHAFDAGRQMVRAARRRDLTPAERERVERYLAARRRAAAPSPLFGAARGRNVIVVMVESLSAFAVDLTVEGTPVMPNLRAFARRSMSFDRFHDQTWSASTADAELASLQSLHPLDAGAVQTRFTENAVRGLPAVLAEHGYGTVSAHAYSGELWKRREIYPKLGFQRSWFLEHYAPGQQVGLGLGDVDFVRQTMPRLREERAPYFAFLVTLSTHFAYDTPREYHRVHPRGLEGSLLGRYLNAVRYVDDALGLLFAELDRSGQLDSSVVVVFGDHRPRNLGPPGQLATLLERYAGYSPETAASATRYWTARHRLPLLIHLPGDTLAGARATAGGQLDIAPTVLSLLGLRDGSMPALGRDLTAPDAGLVVMRDGAFVRGDTLCTPDRRAAAGMTCTVLGSGRPVDGGAMAPWAAAAHEELMVSDLIIRGDYLRGR